MYFIETEQKTTLLTDSRYNRKLVLSAIPVSVYFFIKSDSKQLVTKR